MPTTLSQIPRTACCCPCTTVGPFFLSLLISHHNPKIGGRRSLSPKMTQQHYDYISPPLKWRLDARLHVQTVSAYQLGAKTFRETGCSI